MASQARRAELDREMDRLRALLGEAPRARPKPTIPAGLPLPEALLRSGAATRSQLDLAQARAARSGSDLVGALLGLGQCDESAVLEAVCASRGIPFLETPEPPAGAAAWLQESVARRYLAVPLAREEGEITLALPNPLDAHALEELAKALGLHVRPAAAPRAAVAAALDGLYPPTGS